MKYDSAAVVWFQDQSMSIIIISAKGATGDWSNSTPTDGKMGKGKILAIAGLGIRLAWVLKTMRSILCSSTIFLHHFPTLIGAGQHAQGLHKGRKWVKGAKITRFA